MIKKNIYGKDLKTRLLAASRDRLFNFVLADGAARGAIVCGTRMVREMRVNHELGILETLVLGHGYLAGALMSASLKGNDRIAIHVDCSGPIKGLVVEANAFGEVRGYLKNIPIPVDKPLNDFNLSPFYGAGFLSVTRYLEDAKHPFEGRVTLEYGSLAKDLAYYYLTSEQVPTAINLSIQFDPQGNVAGAGGMFLQAMPGAEDEVVERLESLALEFPSLGAALGAGAAPDQLVLEQFAELNPKFLANHRVEFMCHCSRDRTRSLLAMLPLADLEDMLKNGPFPVELRCHNCNTAYLFDQMDIRKICGVRFASN